MSPSRHRIVLAVSLQPSDQALLEKVRSRFARYATHLNVSEVVRISLELASHASPEIVQTAIHRTVRVKSGRPVRRWEYDDPAFEQEKDERTQRFALLNELQALQAQAARTPIQELRLREICQALNMVLPPKVG